MNILGLSISRTKAALATTTATTAAQLQSVHDRGWLRIFESWAGAWQHDIEITLDNVTTHPTVFACVTLIASDIAKMRIRLVQQDDEGIWNEIERGAFSPVLRKPNRYQNRIQFHEHWIMSKLLFGNSYVLKVRDNRGIVREEYVLNPQRVTPLVSPMGDVFYKLERDDLSQLPEEAYTVPASEIVHDRWNCLFHPLVGLSPIYACGLAAVHGLNIMNNAATFFGNGSNPGGVIEVPGKIDQAAAERVKAVWATGFSGDNSGKVAVLADGMKYVQLKMSAVDSQLIDQLRWTSETICSVFHVPAYMVGVGTAPAYNNIEALATQYYTQCLQVLIESIELCQDEGLGLTEGDVAAQMFGTEFDLSDLLRMDSATQIAALDAGRNYFTPNEGRRLLNLKAKAGGDVVYRQQQDYSIEALNKRDAGPDPFGTAKPDPPRALQVSEAPSDDEKKTVMLTMSGWRHRAHAVATKFIYERSVA